MRIGISAYGTKGLKSGLGHYLRNLLRVFLRDHGEHEYVVYCQSDEKDAFRFPELNLEPEFRLGSERHSSALYDILWHNFVLPRQVKKDRIDVLFVAVDRRVPIKVSVPCVGTVHDLAAFTVDDKYPLSRQVYSKKLVPFLVNRCDRVVTVSEATLRDMVQHLTIPREKIALAPEGVFRERFQEIDRSEIPAAMERYGVRAPYLLYTARLEHPGKNHVNLVEAMSRLQEGPAKDYQLVFVGSPWRNVDMIEKAIDDSGMRDRVCFTGYVADDDLPLLYAGADLFVFPSRYEGFGLPLLEALAAGVPMAVSKVSSLPEVAGPAAEYFDPDNVDDMAQVIEGLIQNEERRQELVQLGLDRVKEFTWERCAGLTLDAILEAGGQKPSPRDLSVVVS